MAAESMKLNLHIDLSFVPFLLITIARIVPSIKLENVAATAQHNVQPSTGQNSCPIESFKFNALPKLARPFQLNTRG